MRVFLTFDPMKLGKNNLFEERNSALFEKHGITYAKDIGDCEFVFYLMNMGSDVFVPQLAHMWDASKRFDFDREMRNVLEMSQRSGSAHVLLYRRADGADNNDNVYKAIRDMGLESRVIFICDFVLDVDALSNGSCAGSQIQTVSCGGGNYHFLQDIFRLHRADVPEEMVARVRTRDIDRAYHSAYRRTFAFSMQSYYYAWSSNYAESFPEERNRPIDVFYVKHYRDTLDGVFRRKVLNLLKTELPDLNVFTEPIRNSEYIRSMSRSKIVLCTYGLGESEWEFKAIKNNCVVLKPDCSHL